MTVASAVPSLSPASDTVAAAASRSGRRRRGLGPYPDKFGSSTSELRAQVEMMAWPDPAVLRRRRLPVCPPLTSSFDSPLHWCPTAEEAHQPRRETRFRCCTLSSNLTSVRNSRAPLPRLQRHRLQVVVGEADGGGLQHGKVDEEAGLLAAGQLPASSKGLRRGLWAHGSLKRAKVPL